jgi:hypothetical protein
VVPEKHSGSNVVEDQPPQTERGLEHMKLDPRDPQKPIQEPGDPIAPDEEDEDEDDEESDYEDDE